MTSFENLNRMPLMIRLLLIFITTTLSLLVLVAVAINYIAKDNQHQVHGLNRFFADYGLNLAERIGMPAQLDTAQKLAKELSLIITINETGSTWSSYPESKAHEDTILKELDFKKSQLDNVYIARRRGTIYISVKNHGREFIISNVRNFSKRDIPIQALLIFVFMLVVLYLSYRSIRALFLPIKDLQEGSRQFSQGNLEYRIPIARHDELGSLTAVMNNMADKIEQMLQAKRQMLLAISHELRTPLTRMKLATELLTDDSQQECLRKDILEMESLINDLLESERLNNHHQVLNIENIDLQYLIADVVDELSAKFENRIRINGNQSLIMGVDAIRFKLLIKNLTLNALQHSEGMVDITLKQELTGISIVIQDRGEGIEEEHIQHLTEPFYRVDRARLRKTGGIGLGLYLCKLIVEAHNGSMRINSRLGQGMTVIIELTK